MISLPLVHELVPPPAVTHALVQLANAPGLLLLESARPHPKLGRYSFLTAEPVAVDVTPVARFGIDPFKQVKQWSSEFTAESLPDLPPFQGGFAGLLSYELGGCWEKLPVAQHDEFQLPACVIGMYDWVLAWDHQAHRCWIIAHGFPESTHAARQQKAAATCRDLCERLTAPTHSALDESHSRRTLETKNWQLTAQQFPLQAATAPTGPAITSNFSEASYLAAVERVIEYIRAGDIFQANLSQRLLTETSATATELYRALRQHNPAPFAGLLQFDDWAILSSSPERFLQKRGTEVSTRPIKGTRQRRSIPEADLFTRDELRESEKDQAENVMIVDLLRNDLSRICRPGSVRVPELCTIETYETVTHLVSEVTGELRPGCSFWDLLRATFPGGSITGAPKIRAMEIITELEQVARGPYCGSLFYCGFDGTADSNILIRTLTQRHGHLTFPVGGGVVVQSSPQQEYQETLHKAQGMLAALHALPVDSHFR